MRDKALALLLFVAGCSIPGIAPEGRSVRVTHQEIPASPADVHARAVQTLSRIGYTVDGTASPQLARGEKPLGGGLVNVVETRISGTTTSRVVLHGWTDQVTPMGRRQASRYDESVSRDVLTLSQSLSCPAAQWPACP